MSTFPIAIPRPVHPTGLWNWITTIDHKKIGILYGVTAFIMFISGGIEATLMLSLIHISEHTRPERIS